MKFIVAFTLCFIILLLTGCQSLRDSMHAARINQNLEQTDAWIAIYSAKANK